MRRFLVWAAVLATALLVSATDTAAAKPIARKRDSKPRGWVLAGDLADNEELVGQRNSGGYLRGSETAATLAYTDKTSASTAEKASPSYTAKANPPSSASYGEKTVAGATTTASPITTSTGAVKQGFGVSSVIVPWGSVTAKASAYSNTEAPTPAPQRTDNTGGGLHGGGVKVDNPTAPTSAEKATAWYNTKTEEPSTAPLRTPLPPTAPSSEKASTSPYSATDTLKQGEVVSSVIVPWGSVTSNSKGSTPTERIEENGEGGAYGARVKVHDAIPATDSKGEAKQSDSNVHESPAEAKTSDSKFGFSRWSPSVSGDVERTAPSLGPDSTSTSSDYTSAPLSGISSAGLYSGAGGVAVATKTSEYPDTDAPTWNTNYGGDTEKDKHAQTTDKSDSTADDRGSGHSAAPAPAESTMTYNSEVDSPAGEKTRFHYSENPHTPSEHNERGVEEQLSFREKSSSSGGGGGQHEGRVEEFTVPWRNEAPGSPGYSRNHALTSEAKKQSEGTEHDAAKETTNGEPAHNSPVYDGVFGRVIPWNDGKPQLVIGTAMEKPPPYPDHAEADAYPEEQTESRDYGHLLGDLTPWRESHSLLQRELQAADNEQPTEQPAPEVTSDEPQEVSADKAADQTDDKTGDQSAEEKSAEQQEDTSTEQPANQPTETSSEQPSEYAETVDDGEVMKTTAVVDENVRWNQDDCNPCDVPTQPPTSAPLYPRNDDDYEQQLPNVTDAYESWDHVKRPEPASTKPPKKKKTHKPSTQPPPSETPYERTPSPETPTEPPPETPATTTTELPAEPPTEPPEETPAPTTTESPTETPYGPTSTPQPSEPATTTPPTESTPAPTKPSETTPAPSEPTPAPTKPGEATPAPTKPGEATPAPTKAYDDSKPTPVSTSKGTSTFPTGTKATTSKTATPVATTGPSTPAATSVDTSTGNTAYGTSGITGGSNDNVVGASTSEGNTSSGSSDALSGGAIAGIVIACVVFAAVVVGAVLYRQRSIARQREENLFADLAAGGAGRALETDYAAM